MSLVAPDFYGVIREMILLPCCSTLYFEYSLTVLWFQHLSEAQLFKKVTSNFTNNQIALKIKIIVLLALQSSNLLLTSCAVNTIATTYIAVTCEMYVKRERHNFPSCFCEKD